MVALFLCNGMAFLKQKAMAKYNVLDLFCGCGGLSCGLDQVPEIETKVALDFEPKALKTFHLNFPNVKCVCGNICDETIKQQIVDYCRETKVNMVVGGPPCQGFSLKGKKMGLNDPRNFLFLEYVELVRRIQPAVFVIENVKNLINTENHYFIHQIYACFEEMGYYLNHAILNASDFGVPQNRERAIIIGQKARKIAAMPQPFATPKITVRDAISDLAYLESGEGSEISDYRYSPQSVYQRMLRNGSTKLYNHKATAHSVFALEKLRMIPPEGDRTSLPKDLYGKQQFSTTWARLVWNKQSPTIDTRFDTPSNGRNSHPELNRAITPREAARLQSFPDTFIFVGNKCAICKQIGNAVPPLLAKAIGQHIVIENQDLL